MARLILDTGILVGVVRATLDLGEIAEGDDIALPALVIAEFLAGVEGDASIERQASQRAFLDDLLAVVPVCDYTPQVAAHHGELLVHVRRTGRPRGPHDLIIAATARATSRVVLTTDAHADFAGLPGVDARLITRG